MSIQRLVFEGSEVMFRFICRNLPLLCALFLAKSAYQGGLPIVTDSVDAIKSYIGLDASGGETSVDLATLPNMNALIPDVDLSSLGLAGLNIADFEKTAFSDIIPMQSFSFAGLNDHDNRIKRANINDFPEMLGVNRPDSLGIMPKSR